MQTALIILAAGKGTRMRSDLPKVLHPIAGVPMLTHVLSTAAALDPARTVVVTGHGAEAVEAAARDVNEDIQTVRQEEQLGTGHAVAQARPLLQDFDGLAMVLFGDTPFIREETLHAMRDAAQDADVVVLGFEPQDPGRYGRLVMDGDRLDRIVEYKDASEAERAISMCNGGLMACSAQKLFELIDATNNENASGEYYLTDIPALAGQQGLKSTVVTCTEDETIGINNRAQLAEAERFFQNSARAEALEIGVTLVAPETVHFAQDTVIGRDTLIEPNVVFGPGVTIETGAHIRAFSHLEGCHVSRGAVVGPYARLRPGAELAEDVRIGNFVEIKNAEIAEGAKVNHLTYIGDATIGARSNIGAGTITCNYDGVMKHQTTIGADVFIGSNTMLIAPVSVGNGALTGTGSIVKTDIPGDAIAIPPQQVEVKEGRAGRYFDMLRAKKARHKKG
ncbi:bifunctional UDP-N-acetylglucosamine diphosphorylase/glucosamine-1-phosphate N-acetyltransferase GlmU [Aliishimia ponticola]|uniref:Bifunctional protein GlmU n=1 Tax=Aliishimia ponticola TaxID=2499833 RepID=A0A4S4NGZ1_9RHOB|nr:bifunctional UDP-N-acetylglucosamine diphosphorylase/glucosamine-1-phosphate N-acetyltransferase GlmU [Aliishimia ponticola]THH38936.1 bifunctional UDP-N-acetylglucosamine diphosphorylase/glucosamine-1-phosphate N-acetyltransferase GlmU [Aliishimia ponticola]